MSVKTVSPLDSLKRIWQMTGSIKDYNLVETALKDFEWLKSKISIDWFDKLQTDDKFRVMKIMGVEYDETYTK